MKYEFRIKVGRKVVFSRVGTLESCNSWIKTWEECPMTEEYTYVLRPVLQDQEPIAALERYTPAARVGLGIKWSGATSLEERSAPVF